MTEPYVTSTILEEGILEIEFFHPKHNSLPSTILAELAAAITSGGENAEIEVIILKSGGDRTFCAGASFDELIAINDMETIGRVQGKAVGGGVGVASAVDYCMATKYASIKLSELNVGIGPFVVGPAVERKVGLSAFSQLTINADEFYDAQWAKEKGLFAEVYESAEQLDAAVLQLAQYLKSTNPEARKEIKSIFWQDYDHWDKLLAQRAEKSGRLVLSEYTKQVLAKYK